MAKSFLQAFIMVLIIASVSALQYIGIISIIDSMENIPLWAIIFSTAIVANAITAVIVSNITSLDYRVKILVLQDRVKELLETVKSVATLLSTQEEMLEDLVETTDIMKEENIEVTFDTPIDVKAGEELEVKVQKKGPGKAHMKGKKLSEETRRKISEKARAREQAKREQKERIEKTALESKKRKARAK